MFESTPRRSITLAAVGTLVASVLGAVGLVLAGLVVAVAVLWGVVWRRTPLDADSAEIVRDLEQKNLELRTREDELLHAMNELEQVSRAKDGYLSAVSHELRTPLTSIRAYSEMLADFCGNEPIEVREDFLRVIVQESERLTRLINDLLDLARIESGAESWRPKALDLTRLLKLCFDTVGGLAIEKMVSFQLDAPDEEIWIEGDRDRLQQAITNVLANACRFSPVGSSIDVTLERGDYRCTIRVRDHGPGIPEGDLTNVFDRFVQVVGSGGSKREGTGLGLSITKEIVEQHGGEVFCQNHADGGAVFVFRLPGKAAAVVTG